MLALPARLAAVQQAAEALAERRHGLSRLVHLAAETLRVDYGFVTLVDGERERFTAVAGSLSARLPHALAVEDSVCRHLVDLDAPMAVPDLRVHPVLRELTEVRELGLRSYAGTPVRDVDGRVLGGFCVAHGDVRHWEPAETALLRGLAEAASRELQLLVATRELERLRAVDQRRAEEQAALRRVAVAVARGAEPRAVLDLVGAELGALLGGTATRVLRLDEGGELPSDDAGLVARVQGSGRSAVSPDQGRAVVPVQVGGRTWGVLLTAGPGAGRPEVVVYLEELAAVVGLVVVNTEARLLLHAAARTDPLTGTANRRGFDEQLAAELSRAGRHDQPLLLALADVDRFKSVNDRHGHQTGDRVLVELVERIRPQLRALDALARVGGDEFAVLLPDTGLEEGRRVLERVRASVAERPLAGVDVTLTAGLAESSAALCSADALYGAADSALYAAKARGRDRVEVAGDQVGAGQVHGVEVEQRRDDGSHDGPPARPPHGAPGHPGG